MTRDYKSYLDKTNWNALNNYRKTNKWELGLTANFKEYGYTVVAPRLEWAEHNNGYFYYSFNACEYISNKKEYEEFFKIRYKTISIRLERIH